MYISGIYKSKEFPIDEKTKVRNAAQMRFQKVNKKQISRLFTALQFTLIFFVFCTHTINSQKALCTLLVD